MAKSQYGRFLYISNQNPEKTIRLLTEPDQWEMYDRHWWDGGEKHPCTGEGCVSCETDQALADCLFFPVLEIDSDTGKGKRIMLYEPPKSVLNDLVKVHYKRRGTLTDRDYTISRTGSGKNNTRYTVSNEDKKKRETEIKKAEKSDPVDIDVEMQALLDKHLRSLNKVDDDGDDDDDTTTSDGAAEDLTDEDDETDFESMTVKELRALCDDQEIEYEQSDKKKALVALLEAEDDEEGDDDDEDESDDDDADESDDDDDDEDVDLSTLTPKELRALCDEQEIEYEKSDKKKDLIALLEADDDEDEDSEDDDDDESDEDDSDDSDSDDDDDDDDESDDDDDDDEDEAGASMSGTFEVRGIDTDEGTLHLVDSDSGEDFPAVFYDEDETDIPFKKGMKLKVSATKDDENDWVCDSIEVAKGKAAKAAPKAKGKAKKK
jgi:cold shock CspA family protein